MNKQLTTRGTESVQDTSTTNPAQTDVAKQDLKSEKVMDSIRIEPDDTKQTRVSKNKR